MAADVRTFRFAATVPVPTAGMIFEAWEFEESTRWVVTKVDSDPRATWSIDDRESESDADPEAFPQTILVTARRVR